MTRVVLRYASPCTLGEGIVWHPLEGRWYWLDVPMGRVYRSLGEDPLAFECCFEGTGELGGLAVQEDGSILLFGAEGRVVRLHRGEATLLCTLPGARSRFNDVQTDAQGQVLCGTLAFGGEAGQLFRLEHDGSFAWLLGDLTLPNGMGFSPDGLYLYLVDSFARILWRFRYDPFGPLHEQKVLCRFEAQHGYPDGLCVDAEGDLWVAFWDGGQLLRLSSRGEVLARVRFPTPRVTSPSYGGPILNELLVSTARGDAGTGGEVYQVSTQVCGTAPLLARILISPRTDGLRGTP